MTIISAENDLAVVILIFQVEPQSQSSLIDIVIENSQKIMEKKPGFVSTTLHKSFDGTSMVNYAQWETRKSYEDAINFLKPDEVKIGEKIFEIADPDWKIYKLVFSAGKTPTPISQNANLVTVINKFTVDPKKQKNLVNQLDELRKVVEKLSGFISANVHRSLDGTRVISYAQWKSKEDYQAVYTNFQAIPLLDKIKQISKFTWNIYDVVYTSH